MAEQHKPTIAILDCIGINENYEFDTPTPLLRTLNRPIITQIISELAAKGIKYYELILHHQPAKVEQYLSDGSRWGITVNYHLVKNPKKPFSILPDILSKSQAKYFLLGKGDAMPLLPEAFWKVTEDNLETGVFLNFAENQSWTGWALFRLEDAKDSHIYSDFPTNLLSKLRKLDTTALLDATSLKALQQTNCLLLDRDDTQRFVPTDAHMAAPKIWISRGVSLHPTAKLEAPVFIGSSSVIKEQTSLGPYAVLESNVVIDSATSIVNSLVCYKSYVGENLTITNSVVNRNILVNLEHSSIVSIQDAFLISGIHRFAPLRAFCHFIIQAIAAIILFILSPIYLPLWAIYGITNIKYVRFPLATEDPTLPTFEWPSFNIPKKSPLHFLHNLPALIPLIKGEVCLLGCTPLQPDEVLTLPVQWKRFYYKSKVGLITMANLDYPDDETDERRYASDAFYAIHNSILFDFKMLGRWFLQLLKIRKP